MAPLTLACLAFVAAGPAASRLPEAAVRAFERLSADDVHAYVETLASDAYGGRGIGEPGNRAAEEFSCATLRQNGVTPAGADGSCYQPLTIVRPSVGPDASLRVTGTDGRVIASVELGRNFYPLPQSGSSEVTAPLVFAKYGIVDDKQDDYAGVPARGAIVLVLDGAARRPYGEEAAIPRKIRNAVERGARGIVFASDQLVDYKYLWPSGDAMFGAGYQLAAELAQRVAVAIAAEHSVEPVRRALDQGTPLTARLAPGLIGAQLTIRNVLGIVEGRDPAMKREIVVIGAHLDHEGTDAQGRIFNGADDNASGTAAVLAAATAFARAASQGERPARSVLFALWNGEEKGSLGAEAFVASPQPDRRIVANLNLDMVGRHEEIPDPANWRYAGLPKVDPATSVNTLHVLGYSYSPDLAAQLRDANDGVGLALLEDYDNGAQDLLKRSDNWPFVSHGIPALFLTTGLHPEYHTPEDDTARIDFGKLARVARLAARAAWIVADGPAPALKKR